MKTIKYIAIFSFLILVITSCEDYLTKTIEFEDIGFEPAIVVNAKITDSLDFLNVSVSKNVNYANNSNPDYEFIEGAEVTITIDGEEFKTTEFNFEEDDNLYNHQLFFPDGFLLTGKKYELEVTHPSYTTVTSSTEIAPGPSISNIEYEEDARTSNDFGYPIVEDRVGFTITDNSTEANFYRLQIVQKGAFGFGTTTDDPGAISIRNWFVLLSDESFNGGTKDVSLFFQEFYSSYYPDGLNVEIRNISRGEYLFQQSYDRYRSSQDFGFFAEPTTLFSNIENGFGLFSAEELQYVEVPL